MKVWLNGKLVDESEAKLSVLDHGTLYGDGVFEGIRIYNGKVFRCEAHVERLFDSARYIRLAIPYTKQELTDAMVESLQANGIEDGYIRLVVTRGPGTLGLSPFKCSDSSTFIIADRIELYPQEMYDHGMAVIVAKTVRTSPRMVPPAAKTLNYLNNILAKIEAVDAGVGEAIMLNEHGNVSECTGDNLFIVENNTVITPPLDAGVLPGITRRLVLDIAEAEGFSAVEETVSVDRLRAAHECFLTGSAAEIIGVTKIDDRPVGTGQVGKTTLQLLAAFRKLIAES